MIIEGPSTWSTPNVVVFLFLIRHLYVNSMWLGMDPTLDTRKARVWIGVKFSLDKIYKLYLSHMFYYRL